MLAPKIKKQLISNTHPSLQKTRQHALDILDHVLAKLNPVAVMHNSVSRTGNKIRINDKKFNLSSYKDIYLIGFGKASAGMAQGILDVLSITKGAIITNEKKRVSGITVYHGSHPLPTLTNIEATKKLLKIIDRCDEHDLLIVLISGGGSSMFCHPRVSLSVMRQLIDHLLKAGCTIEELNTIRGHLSHVKLGGLAEKCRGSIISLIFSDVIGDPLDFIASGPTYPGKTTPHDAKEILIKYGLWDKYPSVKQTLGKKIAIPHKKNVSSPNTVTNIILANNHLACTEALRYAKQIGYYPTLLSSTLSGEARRTGENLAKYATVFPRQKTVIVAGGETTVTVKGTGKGGRNQELVLSAVPVLAGTNILLLSIGTDGIDGPTNAAGAIADGCTLQRAKERGITPPQYLANNDAYTFFQNLNDLILTGATGTNLMDIQLILIP